MEYTRPPGNVVENTRKIREAFPHLEPLTALQAKDTTPQVVKNIRAHLKHAFKDTTFRVKRDGMAVQVRWTTWNEGNDPTVDQVQQTLRPFDYWKHVDDLEPLGKPDCGLFGRSWQMMFHDTFGGMHTIRTEPEAPTPEQLARRRRRKLGKEAKASKVEVGRRQARKTSGAPKL
jgi:hypothetical protein